MVLLVSDLEYSEFSKFSVRQGRSRSRITSFRGRRVMRFENAGLTGDQRPIGDTSV